MFLSPFPGEFFWASAQCHSHGGYRGSDQFARSMWELVQQRGAGTIASCVHMADADEENRVTVGLIVVAIPWSSLETMEETLVPQGASKTESSSCGQGTTDQKDNCRSDWLQ